MKLYRYALPALFCAILCGSALGATPPAATPPAATSDDQPFADPIARPQGAIALSHLYPEAGPVRLKGNSASFDISIPLADTVAIQEASVELHFTNSIALLKGRSVLSVRFNDVTVAQVALDPAQPVGVVTVNLPAEQWRPGFNKLTIDATQHYTDQCEDPDSPELWTEIDLFRSRLHYKVAPQQAPYLLSNLSAIFSPGLGGQSRVALLTAPDAMAGQLRSDALPYVAEALALRRRYAPLTVDQQSWTEGAQGDVAYLPAAAQTELLHVLVGTPEELSRALPKNVIPAVMGPRVWLDSIAGGRARLVVTGRTPEEVVAAAHDLAVLQDNLTPDAKAAFAGYDTPRAMPLTGRSVLRGNTTYSFNDLGIPTARIDGSGIHRVSVSLPLAADYYTQENAQADLSLDFAYSAAMGAGSVMNVLVNGEFIQGIFFGNTSGDRFSEYRLHVPVRLLKPGANTLDFELATHPYKVGAACTSQKADYLFAQIMGSSTIHLPDSGHAAVMPDLARFETAGFPFVSNSGNAAGTIYVGSTALEGSALTLIGKLAQTVQGPVDGWKVYLGVPNVIPGQAIVLATADRLPPDYYSNLSTAIDNTKRWPFRALEDLRTVSSQPHVTLGSFWSAVSGKASPAGPFPQQESLTQQSSLGDLGVGYAFHNPHGGAGDTLMVLTADNDARLADRVQTLVQPEVWSQMKGDLVAWRAADAPVFTMQVARHYVVGKQSPWLLLRLSASNNPLPWILAAAVAAALATAAAFLLLRRRTNSLDQG